MEHKSSHFSSGFLLGAIIGAAIVFLVGTEKGKKVLKLIADEGLRNITEYIEEDDLSDEILEEVEPVDEVIENTEDKKEEKNPQVKKTKKRFFRRVK